MALVQQDQVFTAENNTSIRTIRQLPYSQEVLPGDLEQVVAVMKVEFPWLESEHLEDWAYPGHLNHYIAETREWSVKSGLTDYTTRNLDRGYNPTAVSRYASLWQMPELCLPVSSYVLGLDILCKLNNIDPKSKTAKELDLLFIEFCWNIEEAERLITGRRWKEEEALFGKPLGKEPAPRVIFQDAISYAGLAHKDFKDLALIAEINLPKTVGKIIPRSIGRNSYAYVVGIDRAAEVIAHERKHYVAPPYVKNAEAFDFEEIFVTLTSCDLPIESMNKPTTFASYYGPGAKILNDMLDEIVDMSEGDKLKASTQALQALYATAHTRILRGQYTIGERNVEVTGFADLYEQTTGKSFNGQLTEGTDTAIYKRIRRKPKNPFEDD